MFDLATDEADPVLREAVRAFRRRKRTFDAAILAFPIGLLVVAFAFIGGVVARKFSVPAIPAWTPSINVGLFVLGSAGGAIAMFQILNLACPRCGWIVPLKYGSSGSTGKRSSIGKLPPDCPHCGLDLDPDHPRDPANRVRAERAAELVASGDPALPGKFAQAFLFAIIIILAGGATGLLNRVSAGWIAVGILPLFAIARHPGWGRFPKPLPPIG